LALMLRARGVRVERNAPAREPRGTRLQLTAADLSAPDADFSKLTVHGGRMNDMQLRVVERAG
jgi:hypothetical protein